MDFSALTKTEVNGVLLGFLFVMIGVDGGAAGTC